MNAWNWLFLLAQDAPVKAPQQSPIGGMVIMLLPILVIWFVMFIMPQNKERAKRQDMLGGLKKNDAVVTIGGVIGNVSHISEDGKEVTLRVDDNSRIKFQRDAIRDVITKNKDDKDSA